MRTHERLAALSAAGVSIWLDDLSRERPRSGNLSELIENWKVVGVTTNPTIFAGALSHGDAYDQQVRELARRGADLASAIREITVADVRQACDLFSDTWKATGGLDGRVSLAVDPTLVRDSDRVTGCAAQAQQVFTDPETAGIDLTDVFLTLENDGIKKFEKSWSELQSSVRDQLADIH